VPEEHPKPLSEREAETLAYLLSEDFEGVEELRIQAAAASVIGRCACGCATITLSVDRRAAPEAPSSIPYPAVEARTHWGEPEPPVEEFIQVLLFVRDGWLESLELLYYDQPPPRELPPIEGLGPPLAR
jgi:hypothetical protein